MESKIYFPVCVDYNGSNVNLLKSVVYPSYVWRLLECNSNGISSCGVLKQVISSRLKSVKIEYSLKVKLQDIFRTRCAVNFNQSIHWHVQNAVIPCRSPEPLPFLPVIHFFLPLLSADHSSILPHFIQPSISWSTSWSCCFQIHIQYSFGNPIFFHSLYMSKPT